MMQPFSYGVKHEIYNKGGSAKIKDIIVLLRLGAEGDWQKKTGTIKKTIFIHDLISLICDNKETSISIYSVVPCDVLLLQSITPVKSQKHKKHVHLQDMFESNIDIVLTEIIWSNLSFLGGVDSAVSGMMERTSPLPYWTNISQGGTTSGPSFQCFGFSDSAFNFVPYKSKSNDAAFSCCSE